MAKLKNMIDEKSLTKGQLRKLNALRNSIGEFADEAFVKWHAQQGSVSIADDPNIELLEKALNPLMDEVRIPRGCAYAIRRGRGRFIVEAVDIKD